LADDTVEIACAPMPGVTAQQRADRATLLLAAMLAGGFACWRLYICLTKKESVA
jgi:hypothetical protein